MVDEQQFEYFWLRYAPNPMTDVVRNIGVVLFEPGALRTGFCRVRFVPSWQASVLAIDQDADVSMLAALMKEIECRLSEPNSRQEMFDVIEESFSNLVRVSDRQACRTTNPELALDDLVSQFR